MKRLFTFTYPFLIGLLLILSKDVNAQSLPLTLGADCRDYDVHITLTPDTVVVSTSNCKSGYYYKVGVNYDISFTGKDRPSALRRLTSYLKCGNQWIYMPLPRSQSSGSVFTNWAYSKDDDYSNLNPLNMDCDVFYIALQGLGFYNTRSTYYTAAPLPVEMMYFNGSLMSDKVLLNWATASEENNEKFVVERSLDGQNWTVVDMIEGKGTSMVINKYSYVDEYPLSGTSYYRLMQVDFDGTFDYSEVIVIKNSLDANADRVNVYPNPANDFIIVDGDDITLNQVKVFNSAGIETAAPMGIDVNGNVRIDLNNLPVGLYFIELQNERIKFLRK